MGTNGLYSAVHEALTQVGCCDISCYQRNQDPWTPLVCVQARGPRGLILVTAGVLGPQENGARFGIWASKNAPHRGVVSVGALTATLVHDLKIASGAD